MRFSAFAHRYFCEWRVCSDEDFVGEQCSEAEAGDETVEGVGVEEISGDREVLFEVRPLFLCERLVQFGLNFASALLRGCPDGRCVDWARDFRSTDLPICSA